MKNIVIVSLLFVVALCSNRSYTYYSQCDPQWKDQRLGTSYKTICQSGCLMSSVSMMLNTYGIKVDGNVANPGTFDHYLTIHGGYVSGNLYVWDSVRTFGFIFQGFKSPSQVHSLFDQGYHVILNVNSGHHYVLMTGYSGNTFYVNDPGFNRKTYDFSEVVDTGVYSRNQMDYFTNHVINSLDY